MSAADGSAPMLLTVDEVAELLRTAAKRSTRWSNAVNSQVSAELVAGFWSSELRC